MRLFTLALCLALFCAPIAANAAAADSINNPDYNKFINSMTIPGTKTPCCSLADCHLTEYRLQGDHYEAFIDNHWWKVPARRVLHRANPTGVAVSCYSITREGDNKIHKVDFYCFIPASQS